MSVRVDEKKCIGCKQCVKDCFPSDIEMKEGKAYIRNITCFRCGHCIAVCPTNAISMNDYDMNEVIEYDKKSFDISPETLLNFIKYRRSVRHFKTDKIESSKIEKIIDAGRFTQTATNMQDVEYVVVTKNINELRELTFDGIKELAENILANSNKFSPLYVRYAKLWLAMYDGFKENPEKGDKLFFNAPLVIIVTAKNEINGGLASSNMELMTNALGLGTFFSGFFVKAAEEKKEIEKFIGLKENRKIISCMVIGYPDIKYKRTVPRAKVNINYL